MASATAVREQQSGKKAAQSIVTCPLAPSHACVCLCGVCVCVFKPLPTAWRNLKANSRCPGNLLANNMGQLSTAPTGSNVAYENLVIFSAHLGPYEAGSLTKLGKGPKRSYAAPVQGKPFCS